MKDIMMRKGKAFGLEDSPGAMPAGIEYEKLVKDLKKNVEKRYEQDYKTNVQDMRKKKQFVVDQISDKPTKTFVIVPGTGDKGFDEPNDKPAYPQSDIPHSHGLIWSD